MTSWHPLLSCILIISKMTIWNRLIADGLVHWTQGPREPIQCLVLNQHIFHSRWTISILHKDLQIYRLSEGLYSPSNSRSVECFVVMRRMAGSLHLTAVFFSVRLPAVCRAEGSDKPFLSVHFSFNRSLIYKTLIRFYIYIY